MQTILKNIILICTVMVLMFAGFGFERVHAQSVSEFAETSGAGEDPNTAAGSGNGTVNTGQELDLGVVEGTLYRLATGIGGAFVWLGASLFNWTISVLVIQMGSYVGGDTPIGATIASLWIVIRDLFNILFIFGLLYIGFKTILNSGDNSTRKMLISLIAAALLINFSLYFTKVIVDVANSAAFQIYNLMVVADETAGSTGTVRGLADVFLKYASFSSYADPNAELLTKMSEEAGVLPSIRVIAFGFLMMTFMLIAAFVFMAGAFMMIARFVALIFFLIFSPAMFLGWVYPGFSSYSTKWWRGFLNYAFVAPAFLFMIYLSLTVLKGLSSEGATLAAAFDSRSTTEGLFVVILNFFVIIGFLIASLLVARQMGVVGADRAVNMGKGISQKVRGSVVNGSLYAPRVLARTGIGRASEKVEKTFRNWQAKSGNTKMGKVVSGMNLDRSLLKATEKGQSAKLGLSNSYKDNQAYKKERYKRTSADAAEQKREAHINTAVTALNSGQPASQQTMDDLAAAIKGLTEKQLTEELDLDILTKESVAIHLSEKQIETLEKSGKYSDAQIGQVKDARKQGFTTIAQQGSIPNAPNRNADWLAQKGSDEIAKMPTAVFTSPHMAPHITPSMIEAKMKSGLSEDDRKAIRDAIDTEITNDMNRNPSQTPGQPDGGAYTKQWRNWVNRSPMGARLDLQLV